MRNLGASELLLLLQGFLSTRMLLNRAPFFSREQLQNWQWMRIRKLVRHAFQSVPFYRKLYSSASFYPEDLKSWDDFLELPLVTKEQIISHYPQDMLQEGSDPEKLFVSRSSGSSGKVMDIAYGVNAMTTYILAGLRLYSMIFPYRPWHRQLYIYTSPYPLKSVFGFYPLYFVPTLSPIQDIVAKLKHVKPNLIVCYPSHLKQIAEQLTRRDIEAIRPRGISVNSEMSTQKERDDLSEFFGCLVLDEYSSEELTRIAGQCRWKTYHIFEDINYIEIRNNVIVGTNLHNFAMPMIRYVQNDLGQICESDCACGWRFNQLVNLEGRQNDSFVMPSGKSLSSGFLLDATYEFLLMHRTAVRDFCLIQKSPTSVILQIVPGSGWSEKVKESIAGRFQTFLEPGVNFQIDEVEECEKTKTGKRNPIINFMNRKI